MYVLVTTIGHVPAEASLCVTTSDPSVVHASDMFNPSNSRAATVLTAAVASADTHPSTVVAAIVPVIVGAVVSSKTPTTLLSTGVVHPMPVLEIITL